VLERASPQEKKGAAVPQVRSRAVCVGLGSNSACYLAGNSGIFLRFAVVSTKFRSRAKSRCETEFLEELFNWILRRTCVSH
jgi:hypothetical protein